MQYNGHAVLYIATNFIILYMKRERAIMQMLRQVWEAFLLASIYLWHRYLIPFQSFLWSTQNKFR